MVDESSLQRSNVEMVGSSVLESLIDPSVSGRLATIFEKRPPASAPNFSSPISHDTYLAARESIAQAATLMALAIDTRLDMVLGEWQKLQRSYAKQVIGGLKDGVKEQQELFDLHDEEVRDGQLLMARYDQLAKKTAGQLTRDEFDEFGKLRTKADQLKETERKRDEIKRGLDGFARVEQTLSALNSLGVGSIHYIVPSVEEAREKLGNDSYDGPVFDPFRITTQVAVEDIFGRGSTVRATVSSKASSRGSIDLDTLPPFLQDFARIYDHVIALPTGKRFKPGQVRDLLELKNVSGKAVGAYLARSLPFVGIELVGGGAGREFRRVVSGQALNKATFIEHLVNDAQLAPNEVSIVNTHYFNLALSILRDRPEAYDGFTSELVTVIGKNHGLPVSRMFAAKNLGSEESGTKLHKDAKPPRSKEYVFSKVEPT